MVAVVKRMLFDVSLALHDASSSSGKNDTVRFALLSKLYF